MDSKWWVAVLVLVVLVGVALAYVKSEPEVLTMAVIPAETDLLTKEQFTPFVEYLSEYIGQPVELMTVADYSAVVEAMKHGHADLARFGPFSYVLATEEAEVEAVVTAIKEKTGRPNYHSIIIAREPIDDLNGKDFAFTDVGSTSGYLIPMAYIQKEGIEFANTFEAGAHSAVIEAVKNGTVDAGAVADNRYDMAIKEGVIEEGELEIVWQSAPIPNSPIAVQKSMESGLKKKLTDAFLLAPREIVEGCGIGETGYVLATDSDYDPIREVQETLP